MSFFLGLLVVVLGLLVGSFLNAYLWRLHIGLSVRRGRSMCPRCKHELAAADLIPLFSFFILKGRCRYCQQRISWQYPLVELATALSWLGLFLWFGFTVPFVIYCLWTALLIIIFVYDLLHELILDKVTVPAMFFVAVTAYFVEADWLTMILAGVVGGAFFLVQYVATNGRWVGGGDIRLGIIMGLMLGWPGVFIALALAYIVGAFAGVGLIISGKKSMSSHVPFGTFLTVATYGTFFLLDTNILERYFR